MNFIKRVLSTVTGIFVFFFICVFLLMIIGIVAGASSSTNKVSLKDNSVLELELDFPIEDHVAKMVFKEYPFFDEDEKNGLFNIVDAIHYAATDSKIKGISIDNNILIAGVSQTKVLRDALLKFKESGKFIVSYGDIYTQKDYYLNSVADTIYMNPVGIMEFKGLSTERLYYKDFQEKSGLKMEVVKVGKYKSAVEPYLENEMSANNREQITVYLNGLWSEIKNEISQSRTIPVDELNTIADSLLGRTAELAKKSNLIDRIAYHDEYVNGMKAALGVADDEKLQVIKIDDYSKHVYGKNLTKTSKNKIAVIYAEGQIIYGEGDENNVGQGIINTSLKKARDDDKIKAVVLRINSPGGSALASELIWREIELTKLVKPVIVSMGDVAASGGYYIACNADKIYAEATTITGSIGVFGTLPNGKALADKMGINAEQVQTNKNALTYSFFEPLNENQRRFIKEGVVDIYDLFTQRVADGREGLDQDGVKAIGQGRVWTGKDALNNGLVDALGGLDDALSYAAEVAEIKDYKIKEYPVIEKDFKEMFQRFGLVQSKAELLQDELGVENYKILKEIQSMTQQKGIQLLFPFDVEIK